MLRRKNTLRLFLTTLLTILLGAGVVSSASASLESTSPENERSFDFRLPYDVQVLLDTPSGYWPQLVPRPALAVDITGLNHGRIHGNPGVSSMPNGDFALTFNGRDDYVEIPDNSAVSSATTGTLTVEAWIRPDVLSFANDEKAGYVHWMGKGEEAQHEWVSRMYSLDNTVGRENRISGYQFNIDGGLGAGSYYQEPVEAGEWLHYVLVINSNASSENYPAGYTKLFIDGELVDQDSLIYDGVEMIPARSDAPMRIGTRDFGSFFEGAIGKIAVYDYELSPNRIRAHHDAMHH